MLATIKNYDQRIEAGKRVEKNILDSLRALGYKIQDPTSHEDKYDKIDGWWIDKKDNKYPLQIKFRESGDDIIFEMMKDADRQVVGRDMISKAVIYLVANRQGFTRMYLTKLIKEKAKELLDMVQKDRAENPFKSTWRGHGWEIKLTVDRAYGQRKIMGFFDPDMFTASASWQLKIH